MFAVIKTGGKQYRVAADETISVEKLPGEVGDQVVFADVLLHGDGDNATVGTPLISGASVAGEIVEQTRGRKVLVFKRKRRQTYRRTKGHRQNFTLVRITDILLDGAKPAAKKAAAKPAAKTEETASGAPAKDEGAAPAKAKAASKPKAEAKAAKPKTEAKAKAKAAEPAAKKADDKSDSE